MLKELKSNQGITLVELMVVIAILGLVLAAGYQFLHFGRTTYARGEQRSHVQRDMRIAAEYITQEIRYADEIYINPSDKQQGYHYIYIEENGTVIHRNVAGDERVLIDGEMDDADYNLSFQEYDDSILRYILSSGVLNYDLDSKVQALNLTAAIKGDIAGSVIKYTKPHTPIWEYVSLENRMWRDFVRDFYQNTIDTALEEYFMESSFTDTGELALSIAGEESYAAGGAMVFKDIAPYLNDLGTDNSNYTVTIDAQTFTGEGGWGFLINGDIYEESDQIKDNGYMFQFDPGARGFVLRKIKGGDHSNLADIGASMEPGGNSYDTRFGAVYAPEHLTNGDFEFKNTDTDDLDGDWFKRYKTVINVTVVNDTDPHLLLEVKLIDEDGNESRTMKFGDFEDTISMADGSIFKGEKLDFSPWQNWDGSGTFMGLRSWERGSGVHNNNFYDINLANGDEL